ncbi:MAG: glycosyltransferase family 2 protein [Candidatus Dormibacteria bacterium]
MGEVVVFVLNHNGREILRESLPALVAECDRVSARIVLVDNASSDGGPEMVESEFPGVDIFRLERNEVLGAINIAVEHYRPARFVFMVNDLIIQPGCLAQMLEPLADPAVFAVSCFMRHPTDPGLSSVGTTEGSSCGYRVTHGRVHHDYRQRAAEVVEKGPIRTFLAGGYTAYDGEKFRLLGGFDPIYLPFFWEDMDLSIRAWRAGYEVLYAPHAVVLHDQLGGTISRSPRRLRVFTERNRILYAWINLHDRQIYAHVAYLAALVGRAFVTLDGAKLEAVVRAFGMLPAALRRRDRARNLAVISEIEVTAKVNAHTGYRAFAATGPGLSEGKRALA